ncbi:MAG: hypothetical protein MSC31_18230 [Solirubrobacteraceae bacterium MAG38_C4-C5]|nr:hypothetical protein [Candidatus Siliceabacter maunaloa]
MRYRVALLVAGVALLAAASSAYAQNGSSGASQAALEFVGTPSVRYVKVVNDEGRLFYSLAAVVRLSVPIEPGATGFPVAPELSTGDEIGSVFGGDPAGAIGVRSKNCYSVELQRPRPVATPSEGARWRLGVSQGDTVRDTVGVTLKTVRDAGDWQQQAARRLGCDAVGERVQVGVDRLVVNERPNEVYLGRLEEGQSMEVRKLSASGKYAYGFAYGNANKVGWVRTSGLGATSAGDGDSLRLDGDPFMGGLDGGKVAVGVTLSGPAESQGVEIDGRDAEVRRIGPESGGFFQATVDRGRMESGGMYRVDMRFCDGSDCVDFDARVYLRESYSGRPEQVEDPPRLPGVPPPSPGP